MKDLIEALNIFLTYAPPGEWRNPLNCNHDEVVICGVEPRDVSEEDKKRLDELGFFVVEEEDDYFKSFRFGSC